MAKTIAELCQELEDFARRENLYFASADEMLARDNLTPEQRAFLKDFIALWDRLSNEEG